MNVEARTMKNLDLLFFSMLFAITLQVLDIFTTIVALKLGYVESNPLVLKLGFPLASFIKIITPLLVYMALLFFENYIQGFYYKIVYAIFILTWFIVSIFYIPIVYNNMRNILEALKHVGS